MKRIYIAGPMTGLPDHNFPAFHKASKGWREMGWHVISPAESFGGDCTLPYRYYVEHDVTILKTVDAVAVLPGWDSKTARGSVWEYHIARQLLNIPVFDADCPVPPEALKHLSLTGAIPALKHAST